MLFFFPVCKKCVYLSPYLEYYCQLKITNHIVFANKGDVGVKLHIQLKVKSSHNPITQDMQRPTVTPGVNAHISSCPFLIGQMLIPGVPSLLNAFKPHAPWCDHSNSPAGDEKRSTATSSLQRVLDCF